MSPSTLRTASAAWATAVTWSSTAARSAPFDAARFDPALIWEQGTDRLAGRIEGVPHH
jgi:hypothetical protein